MQKTPSAERGAARGLRGRLQFTQDPRQLVHNVTDEEVQAPGQVFIAALLFLAWSGLSTVSLDVHHQSTYRRVQKITSHDKTVDSIYQKTPPRQMFPGGMVPIMLTFRFVASCQAQSVFCLRKIYTVMWKERRQL